MIIRKLATLSVAVLACLAVGTLAQTYRAQVRGLIADQTGAAVPGATVTLSNVNTGVKTVKTTDNAGLYVFDLVDPEATPSVSKPRALGNSLSKIFLFNPAATSR